MTTLSSDMTIDIAAKNRPLIGITAPTRRQPSPHVELSRNYTEAVLAAGCLPVLLPLADGLSSRHLVRSLDAMIFSGGADINPLVYGQQPQIGLRILDSDRDHLEIQLLRAWLDTGKPLLGIGRGMQLLTVASGGTLYQDLQAAGIGAGTHEQVAPPSDPCHSVDIEENSTLAQWMEMDGECWVNSLHHQAVADLAPGFQVSARARDGVIEAVEAADGSPVVGVQWHPEAMGGEPAPCKLFANFAAYCGLDTLLG